MPDKKAIIAYVYLGREFFFHLFKKYVLKRQSPGMKEFIELYRADRTVPLTAAERERHPDYTKCISCGLCDPVCPVMAAGGSTRFAGPMDIAGCISRDLTLSGVWGDPFLSSLCGACDRICPEAVPVSEMIVYLRRKTRQTNPERLPNFYKEAISNLEKDIGVFGKNAEATSDGKARVLYWRGCREAVSGSNVTGKLLDKLGIEYATIAEGCCGGLPSEMGLDYDASPVFEQIRKSGAAEIVTGCPNCANALKRALPDVSVKLAAELVYAAALKNKPLAGKKVAFHDPCKMGRGANVWEPPRAALRAMGAEIVALEREKENAVCCGAGGGLLEIAPDLAEKVARNRIEEVIASGADTLITTCDLCARNIASALRDNDNLKVHNIVELVL